MERRMEQFQRLKATPSTLAAKTAALPPVSPSRKATPTPSDSRGMKRTLPEEVHSSASSVPSKQQRVHLEQTTTEKALPGIEEGELVGGLLTTLPSRSGTPSSAIPKFAARLMSLSTTSLEG